MKYIKYMFGVFFVLGTLLIGVSSLEAETTNRFKVSYVNFRESNFGLIADISIIDYEYNYGMGSTMLNWFEYAVNSGNVSNQWFQVDLPYASKVFILAQDTDILYSSYEVQSLTVGISGFVEGVGLTPSDSSIFPDGFAYFDPLINNKLTVLLSDTIYKDIYDLGYNNALNEYEDYTNMLVQDAFDAGFDEGKSVGILESGELKADIINFIPGVLGSIFMFFFQIGQISLLGISILDILGILVLISGLIFLIKFFF